MHFSPLLGLAIYARSWSPVLKSDMIELMLTSIPCPCFLAHPQDAEFLADAHPKDELIISITPTVPRPIHSGQRETLSQSFLHSSQEPGNCDSEVYFSHAHSGQEDDPLQTCTWCSHVEVLKSYFLLIAPWLMRLLPVGLLC